jgi:hypothetical protein
MVAHRRLLHGAGHSRFAGSPERRLLNGRLRTQTADKEPVTPSARLMEDLYIVVNHGPRSPLNLPVFSAGVATQLARYQCFKASNYSFLISKLKAMLKISSL